MTLRIIAANLVVRVKTLSRERAAIFFTLAFPVILVLVFGAIFTRPESAHLNLPVQDLDQTSISASILSTLTRDGAFDTVTVPPNVDARQYAIDHKLNLVLIIPQGLETTFALRRSNPASDASVVLTTVYDPSSTSVNTKLAVLDTIVAASNQQIAASPAFFTITRQSILDKKYRFIDFFIPGIIAMAVMTSSLSGALSTNAELRQKGILRKLTTTPITRADWLLSSILYQLILATASTVAILLVGFFVFDVRLRIDLWLPLFLLLAVFTFVGIGLLLTPFAKEAESASAAGNAVLFPMMFLSGTFFPVEMMPGFLQHLARVLPLYYVNEGLRAAMIFSDTETTLRCAAIVCAVAAAVFVAGATLTRWNRAA